MNDTIFWSMIEDAWSALGGWTSERKALAAATIQEGDLERLSGAMEDFIPVLSNALQALGQEDLLEFDRILERKLWDIDRAEIQEFTDGSDDGFLYARGFIVAAGQEYYQSVSDQPAKAQMDVECEDMCYLSRHIYEERFGEMPESEISRESASNPLGWPEE